MAITTCLINVVAFASWVSQRVIDFRCVLIRTWIVRNQTAVLGAVNGVLWQNVSICLFKKLQPARISAHFAFFTVRDSRVSASAVNSGHKLDTTFSFARSEEHTSELQSRL